MNTNKRDFLRLGALACLGLPGIAKAQEHGGEFVHIFLMRFKPEVAEEDIETVMSELAGLKEKLPFLREFLVGKNVAGSGDGPHYAQVAVFETKEDLQAYQEHPEHRKVAQQVIPKLVVAEALTVQFEPL